VTPTTKEGVVRKGDNVAAFDHDRRLVVEWIANL
jgi:hypothetical protein